MINRTINCKDYFIIKLRNYADASLLKKWEKERDVNEFAPLPKQHYERARLHNEFFWKFIERITGKTDNEWFSKYMFEPSECAQEEVHETHDIMISKGEGWITYLIPIKYPELIEWVKANVNVPSKTLKKFNLGFWRYRNISKSQREQSIAFTSNFKEKHL